MPDPADPPPTPRDLAIRALWDTEANQGYRRPLLFAVLDAAQDGRIFRELSKFAASETIVPLYQDEAASELAAVAPYLVQFGSDMRMFNWIWDSGWSRNWAIFLWSTRTPDIVRAHLRTLTKIRTESGEMKLFRFYDPRVLTAVLPILDPAQLQAFFGPIARISVEASLGRAIAAFSHRDGILSQVTHRIS